MLCSSSLLLVCCCCFLFAASLLSPLRHSPNVLLRGQGKGLLLAVKDSEGEENTE